MNKNDYIVKDYSLKHAAFQNTLENDVVAASYSGRLIIGPTTLNNDSEVVFEPYRTIVIPPSAFYLLIESMKKARLYFSERPDDHFEMDISALKNNQPRYKLTASFGKWNDAEEQSREYQKQENQTGGIFTRGVERY